MYFKNLELVGFKSFAEKTVLKFEPGITAVVGPNGCGKSNIFDSIRWALGEQSIKSLRGSKMEDVIFNGTEKIPALGFAEVSLTLSNEAHILPIDYEEVTITRRLYRSGESEYLLNNNPVRLKDINDLLMGTGIGAESYSLVEQGKIDLVLSSRPEDRRLVFDEATGVSKYKAKKKEAIRRLEDTENNLLRVNDIILEVKRQISSIERQASKARRYKEVFEQLKALEIKVSQEETHNLKLKWQESLDAESSLKDKINKLTLSLEDLTKKISLHQDEIENLNQEVINLNNDLINSKNSIETKGQYIKINEERIIELNKRTQVIENQKNNLLSRIEHAKNNLSRINSELGKIKEESQSKAKILEEKEFKFKEIEGAIKKAQEELKEANSKIFEIVAAKTKSNNELIDINNSLSSLNARKLRLETEIVKTKNESDSEQKELAEIKEQVEKIRAAFQNTKDKVLSLQNNLSLKNDEIQKITASINKLNETRISLESQKEFLENLKLKYENMPSAKDAELTINNMEKINQDEISGIIAKAKSVSFDPSTKTYRIRCEVKLFSLDIKFIDEKINQTILQIQKETNIINSKNTEADNLRQEIKTLEIQMQQEQIELTDKEAALKNRQSTFDKISDELSLLEFEQKDVGDNIKKLNEKKTVIQTEIERLGRENTKQDNIIISSQSQIAENGKLRESILLEITQFKTELGSVQAKENDISNTVAMLERSLAAEEEAFTEQENEKTSCIEKIEDLEKESANLKIEIEDLKRKTTHIQDGLVVKNDTLVEKEKVLKQLEEEEYKQNSEITEDKENLHKSQLGLQENKFKIDQIKERMLQLYQYNIEGEQYQPSEFNKESTIQEIEALRKKIDSFGTVNLVAIEELEELKTRYEFLEQQQKDLNTAKDSLNEAIRKINQTTRKMFLDTFHTVAKEFKNYFKLLFGGGDAELFLIDEENVLESGIEIVCRPPGKKLQNILLLSGGEKSLAAIALIFAIFKTKPAPFCVLDEIDAALDELNVDRYSRMLKEFASISQFIVITHNKKTIAHANVMYGITMEESGISKIVSVKLSENNNKSSDKANKHRKEGKSALSSAETN